MTFSSNYVNKPQNYDYPLMKSINQANLQLQSRLNKKNGGIQFRERERKQSLERRGGKVMGMNGRNVICSEEE